MAERIQTQSITLIDGTQTEGGWVDLFPPLGSKVHYRGEVFAVDQSFAARILANFTRYLTLYRKEPVMLRQHEREGWQYGVWAALRLSDGRIQGLAAFLDPTALERFKAGQLREWSPGFGDIEDPHTGEVLRDMLVEASFVDRGHQWNLRPPSVTNPSVQLAAGEIHPMTWSSEMDPNKENQTPADNAQKPQDAPEKQLADTPEGEEDKFDMASAFGALTGTLTSMAENQSKIMKCLDKLMGPEEEPEAEATEMAALRAEVRELRRENTLKELAARGITGAVAEGLVTLKSVAPDQYESTLEEVQARFDQPTPKVQRQLGGTASPKPEQPEAAEIIEMAASHVRKGESVLPWVARNHPDKYEAVKAELGV